MDKDVMKALLVPVMGEQSFNTLTFVHDHVVAASAAAHTRGLQDGYALGQQDGYSVGYTDGTTDAGDEFEHFEDGWNTGYAAGVEKDPAAFAVYQAGYDAGHVAGWDAAIDENWDDAEYDALSN